MIGATFVVMSAMKLCAMGGVGMAMITGIQYFLNFELKAKKKGGEDNGVGEHLRERSRQLS